MICVDNLDTGSLQNIEHIRDENFTFIQHDLTEPFFIDEQVDFVYHLASPASPIDYLRLPLHTLKVGSYGTHHMLGLAKKHRARFVLASTSEVYGDPQVHPQPETYWGHVNPIGPRGVYDEAKRYAEALTMAYHRQQGVDTGIVRTFNTYGSRMRPHDGRAIPTFLRQALQDKPLTVFGDGSQTRSFCYVDDQIRGYVAMAESDVHEPVNIGNPHEFTLLELAQVVIEVTESRSEIVYEALPTDDPQVRQPEIPRAMDLLGWEPQVELRDGLRMTIEQTGVERLVGTGDWRRRRRGAPGADRPSDRDLPALPGRRRQHRVSLRPRAGGPRPPRRGLHRARRGVAPDPGEVVVHRIEPVFAIGNAPLIPSLARIEGFDVVHLHYPFIFGSELTLLARLRRRRARRRCSSTTRTGSSARAPAGRCSRPTSTPSRRP